MGHSENQSNRERRHLVMAGQNYRSTPVDLREQLAFDEETTKLAISSLLGNGEISECAVLSTCNRSEVYVVAESVESGLSRIRETYTNLFQIPLATIDPILYKHQGSKAVHQLFAVAAGIDSMVIGEPQILGQVKDAFAVASQSKATRLILNRLFSQAIEVGKKVRTETSIGSGAVSIPFAAVEIVKNIFDKLGNRSALVVGAGETGVLAARHLKNAGFGSIVLTNRTFSKAARLAEEIGGSARRFEDLTECLVASDVVLCATSSPEPILKAATIAEVARDRKMPFFLVDLAVPRDIDPAVRKISGAILYDLDDLKVIVDRNQKQRIKEAERGRSILEEEVGRFGRWMDALDSTLTIRLLRSKLERISGAELERHGKGLSPEEKKHLQRFAHGLLNKILHTPTLRLKSMNGSSASSEEQRIVKDLFALEEEDGE